MKLFNEEGKPFCNLANEEKTMRRLFREKFVFKTSSGLRCVPTFLEIGEPWSREFWLENSSRGALLASEALNYGNSGLPLRQIQKVAFDNRLCASPRDFIGLALTQDSTRRLVFAPEGRTLMPNRCCYRMDNLTGHVWDIYGLFLKNTSTWEASRKGVGPYYPGMGFVVFSASNSYTIVMVDEIDEPMLLPGRSSDFVEPHESTRLAWHVYGGGGNNVIETLERVAQKARDLGALIGYREVPDTSEYLNYLLARDFEEEHTGALLEAEAAFSKSLQDAWDMMLVR